MTASTGREGAAARWIARVTTVAVLVPLPYSVQRVLWAAGLPVGVDRALLDDFQAPGWGSLYILGLVVLAEGTALWTHVFVRSRADVVPAWVPLAGGRPVKPWMVIAPLLAPIAILAEFNLFTVSVLLGDDDFGPGVPAWSLVLQAVTFAIWGVALTIATIAYARAQRTSRAPAVGSAPPWPKTSTPGRTRRSSTPTPSRPTSSSTRGSRAR